MPHRSLLTGLMHTTAALDPHLGWDGSLVVLEAIHPLTECRADAREFKEHQRLADRPFVAAAARDQVHG